MKKKIEKFKDRSYIICKDISNIEGLSLGKIYIIYKIHNSTRCIKIRNDSYRKTGKVVSIFANRFKKATKKEINDNLVDITVRKLKNEI